MSEKVIRKFKDHHASFERISRIRKQNKRHKAYRKMRKYLAQLENDAIFRKAA